MVGWDMVLQNGVLDDFVVYFLVMGVLEQGNDKNFFEVIDGFDLSDKRDEVLSFIMVEVEGFKEIYMDVIVNEDIEVNERIKVFEVFGFEELYRLGENFVLNLEILFMRRLIVYDDIVKEFCF